MTESTDNIIVTNQEASPVPEEKTAAPVEEGVESPIEEVGEPDEHEIPEPEDLSDKSIDELPLPEEDEAEEKKKKLPKWADKRLSRKEREVEAARAESAALRAQLEASQTQHLQTDNTPQTYLPNMPEPQREDYDSDIAWVRAVNKYDNEKAAFQQNMANFHREQEDKKIQFKNKFSKTIEAGVEKYNDFEDTVAPLFSPDFPANAAMGEAVFDSEFKDDILYFLGKYKAQAREIALSGPINAVKKIAEIEMRFKNKKPSDVSKTKKILTPLTGGKTANAPLSNNDIVKVADSGTQQQFEDLMRSLAKKKQKF